MGVIDLKIQRTLLEITNSNELTYKADEIQISTIIKSALPRLIEEILANATVDSINIEIPKLEISLGLVSKPFDEEVITNSLRSQLRLYLEKILENNLDVVDDKGKPEDTSQKRTKEGNEIDVLLFFLENGYLPWYANSLPAGSHLNDNNLIIRVGNYISTSGGEKAIQRLLSQYEFKDIIRFTSGLVLANFKEELVRLNQIVALLLKSERSISSKLANAITRQILSDLIRNSGQLQPAKNLLQNVLAAKPEFKGVIEENGFSRFENASAEDISLIIEEALADYEKRKVRSTDIDDFVLLNEESKEMILHYLSNGSIPINFSGIKKTDLYKQLSDFFKSYSHEIVSIYNKGESKRNDLNAVLVSLPDEYLKTIFQYYIEKKESNDLQTNEFIDLVKHNTQLTSQNKLTSAKLIIEQLVNKKFDFSAIVDQVGLSRDKQPTATESEVLSKIESSPKLSNEKVEPVFNFSNVYFNDLLNYYFENGIWPWWIDNYIKVFGNLNINDSDTSLISVLDNYQQMYPTQFTTFTLRLITAPNNTLKTFGNLPWVIAKKLVNSALPGYKNTFSDTLESILKLSKRDIGMKIIVELATQQFVYKILRDTHLISLGYTELVNLLLLEVANQLSVPLWQVYSLILKKHEDLALPHPLTKAEIDAILIYNQDREEQFVQLKENKKLHKEFLNLNEINSEFISDKDEELILNFVKGENVNLNFFPTSFSLRDFILDRIAESKVFLTKLYEIVLSEKNKALFKLLELEHITGVNFLEVVLDRKENKEILNNVYLLLSDLHTEEDLFFNDSIRIALANERIWQGDVFSREVLQAVLQRLSTNLSIDEGVLEAAVVNSLSKSTATIFEFKEQLNPDSSPIPLQNANRSLELLRKINYEWDLLNELYNFVKANNHEPEIQGLISNLLRLKNQPGLENFLISIKDDSLSTKVLTYVDGLNTLEFDYFLKNIQVIFAQDYQVIQSNLDTNDSKIKLPASSALEEDESFLITLLFNFIKSKYDKNGVLALSQDFQQIKSKEQIQEWISVIDEEALKLKFSAFVERISNQEFSQLTEAIKLLFRQVLKDETLILNVNAQQTRSLLLDIISSKVTLSEFNKISTVLLAQESGSLADFTKAINSIGNSSLAELIKTLVEGKTSALAFQQLINIDKVEALKIRLEFWKDKLDFKSEHLTSKLQSLRQNLKTSNDSVTESLKNSLPEPLKDAGYLQEGMSEQFTESLKDTLNSPLQDALPASLNVPLQDAVEDVLKDTIEEPLKDSLTDTSKQALTDPVKNSLKESVNNSLSDSVKEPIKDESISNLTDSLKDLLKDSLKDPVLDSLSEPLKDAFKDPLKDSLTDSLENASKESLKDSLEDPLKAAVKESFDDPLKNSRSELLEDSLKDQLQERQKNSLTDPLEDALVAPVMDTLKDSLSDLVKDAWKDESEEMQKNSLPNPLPDALKVPLQDTPKDSLSDLLEDSSKNEIQDRLQDSLKDAEKVPLKETLKTTSSDSKTEPLNTALTDSYKDSLKDPVLESLDNLLKEDLKEPLKVKDSGPMPLSDLAQDLKSGKASLDQQKTLSFITEEERVILNTSKTSSADFKGIEIITESDLPANLSTFYNPHSIAEILSYFLSNFQLPWWSAIKDLKEFERIVKGFSISGNNLFRQKIIQFAAQDPNKFTSIILQIIKDVPLELRNAESKLSLENALQKDLDFLSEFRGSFNSGDRLMPYLSTILADFKFDTFSEVKEKFRKLILTTLIHFNPQAVVFLERFNQNSSHAVASDYTKTAMELRLLSEIKSKEVEKVLYFLNEMEVGISVGAENASISISQNIINLYTREAKISVHQLLQVWLTSIETIKKVPGDKIKQYLLNLEKNREIDKSLHVAKELLEIVRQDKPLETLITLPYLSFINSIELILNRLTTVSVAAKKEALIFLSTLLSADPTLANLPLYFNLVRTALNLESVKKEEISEIILELKTEFTDPNLNYILENVGSLMKGESKIDRYALMTNQKTGLADINKEDIEKTVNEFLEQFNLRKDVLVNLANTEVAAKSSSKGQIEKEVVKRKKQLDINLDERIYIPNAGLVILWPFLSRLFTNLNYTEKGKFLSPEKRLRAIYLSQYLIGFTEDNPEYTLMLNKLLCGMDLNEPIDEVIKLTEEEKAETHSLLGSVIAQWKEMNNTSIENFQKTFLQREGVMYKTEENWNVLVGKSTFDVLLLRLPWGMSIIKYSWNNYLIFVEWKAMT